MAKKSEGPVLSVRITEDADYLLDVCQKTLSVNRSTAVRMAIESLHSSLGIVDPENAPAAFLGSPEVVAQKWKIVECFRQRKGECMAAREARTTRRTINFWMAQDPVFLEFCQDAWDETIEMADQKLWHQGHNEGNTKALFGTLNAHHESFGMLRRQYIEDRVRSIVEKDILPVVAARLSTADMDSIKRQLSGRFGRLLPGGPG